MTGQKLLRLQPETGATTLSTTMPGSAPLCTGLAATEGRVFRVCEPLGMPTVNLVWQVDEYDGNNAATTPLLDTRALELDIQPLTGLAADPTGFWATGWGYGEQAGLVVRLEADE